MTEKMNELRVLELLKKKEFGDDLEGRYIKSQRTKALIIVSAIVFIFFLSVLAISIGAIDIPFVDTLKALGHAILPSVIGEPSKDYFSTIIIRSRLPRILLAILTGTSLAIAGAIMQGLLRNPLVSPFTLGVSTAASFGAAISIVFGSAVLGSSYYLTYGSGMIKFSASMVMNLVSAFAFGLLSIVLVLLISRNKGASKSTVILSGVIISYLFQAGIMFTKYISDDDQLREITLWIMGSMGNATWGSVVIAAPIVIICMILLEKISLDLNAMSSGDDVASNLGVDVPKLRRNGLILATLATSACICFTGAIGFVGLMAPHLCRMLIGNDHRFLIPFSACAGTIILLASDIVARIAMRPQEIPIGIIMYVLGGLFFIWMSVSRKWGDRL